VRPAQRTNLACCLGKDLGSLCFNKSLLGCMSAGWSVAGLIASIAAHKEMFKMRCLQADMAFVNWFRAPWWAGWRGWMWIWRICICTGGKWRRLAWYAVCSVACDDSLLQSFCMFHIYAVADECLLPSAKASLKRAYVR